MAVTHLEAFLNVNRDPEKQRKPFALPRPWGAKSARDQVTDEELVSLEHELEARSAFAK